MVASDTKSQPVELDYSTTELHVPSRRKKSLQSYCSVVSLAAVFSLVTQRSSPEERCVTRLKTAVRETNFSVDFGFLALMPFDVTFDVTLCDDSSFGKLTNSCN